MRRPYIDKAVPEAWQSAQRFSTSVREAAALRGLSEQESELIKVRVSQLNGCAFCLDLHSREARQAGVTQQQLDLLPAWRETDLYGEREKAVLAVAEAGTALPLTEESQADLAGSAAVLGEETLAAAEWVTIAINTFNRVSILSEHRVRPRDAEGRLVR